MNKRVSLTQFPRYESEKPSRLIPFSRSSSAENNKKITSFPNFLSLLRDIEPKAKSPSPPSSSSSSPQTRSRLQSKSSSFEIMELRPTSSPREVLLLSKSGPPLIDPKRGLSAGFSTFLSLSGKRRPGPAILPDFLWEVVLSHLDDMPTFLKCLSVSKSLYLIGKNYLKKLTQFHVNRASDAFLHRKSAFIKHLVWAQINLEFEEIYLPKFKPHLRHLIQDCPISPPCTRKQIWIKCLEISGIISKNPDIYFYCSQKSCNLQAVIKKDIGRTFPNHPDLDEKKLFRVLCALSNFNEGNETHKYCQGLNYIAGILSIVMQSEEETFWSLVQFLKIHHFDECYKSGLPGTFVYSAVLDSLIVRFLPEIGQLFANLNIRSHVFSKKWFLTAFACALPLDYVLQIWDLIMLDSWGAIFKVSLSLLMCFQEEILKVSDVDDICYLLDSKMRAAPPPSDKLFSQMSSFDFDSTVNPIW